MALDPSVILQGTPTVQIQNPLTVATQAATMSNLMQEHQMNQIKLGEAQREQLDRTTMRDAFKNNTQSDPDGNPIVDRGGVMRDLMKANPMLAQKQALDFRQMDLDKLTKDHEIGSQLAMSINPNDESTFLQAQARAKQYGLPDLAQQLPKFSDPNFPSALNKFQVQMLNTKDRLEQQNKETGFQIERQKADVEKRKLDVEMAHYNNDKQMKAVEDYNTGASGSRQQADAVKMENDHLSAQKISEIKNQAPLNPKTGQPDLNGLNPQQMKMIMAEGVKMVTGGAPTVSELEEMTPNNMAQKYSKAWQGITNKSQPANAGEFVQQVIDYSNGIDSIAKKGLTQRSTEMMDRLSPFMNEKSKSTIKNQIAHEFDSAKAPASKFSSDVTAYAAKHGITQTQAQAIKDQRTRGQQ